MSAPAWYRDRFIAEASRLGVFKTLKEGTMKHAREDYNEITTDGVTRRIPKDEPVFLLRAQDACSADAVRHWAALAEGAGAHPEIIGKARQHAALMDAWPVKKVPDLPGYTPTPPKVDENAPHDDRLADDHAANQRALDQVEERRRVAAEEQARRDADEASTVGEDD